MTGLRGFTQRKGVVGQPSAVHPLTDREWVSERVETVDRAFATAHDRECVSDELDAYYAAWLDHGYYDAGSLPFEKLRVAYVTPDAARGFVREYRDSDDVYAVVACEPGKGSETGDDQPQLRDVLADAYPEISHGGKSDD